MFFSARAAAPDEVQARSAAAVQGVLLAVSNRLKVGDLAMLEVDHGGEIAS
jgi:hypothetical protein